MSELTEQLKGSLKLADEPKKKLATIQIKGKEYTMVKDRILYFNEVCPNGCIETEILNDIHAESRFVINAIVTPDADYPSRKFTGKSQALIDPSSMINSVAALENAETSAVGRALAMMGIGIIESVASADELSKAKSQSDVLAAAKLRAAEEKVKLAEKQGTFELKGDVLSCKIIGIQKKQMGPKTKTPGKEFRSVTFNGRLENGSNYASVFDTELWEPLEAALDHECQLRIEVRGAYAQIRDVLWIEGVSGPRPVEPWQEPA